MIFLQTNWILAFVCAVTYYRIGKMEAPERGRGDNGMIWAGLSIGISALIIQWLGAGWMLVLLSQIGLFIAITVFRTVREP
jgi:hypothetical protein